MIPLLYCDDDFLILDKPAGLAVQPGAGVTRTVLEVLRQDHGLQGWLVHRLDKDTAGCLAVARSAAMASRLGTLLDQHACVKKYWLACFGIVHPATDILRDPVRVQGKYLTAATEYTLLSSIELEQPALPMAERTIQLSLVEARLQTGRMHQIRQQFAAKGWPLVGDDKYGDFKLNKLAARHWGLKKLLLFARSLRLPLQPPVEAVASLPPHFARFFAATGMPQPEAEAGIADRSAT